MPRVLGTATGSRPADLLPNHANSPKMRFQLKPAPRREPFSWQERLFVVASQVAILAIVWREVTGTGTIMAIGSYNLGTYEFILAIAVVALIASRKTIALAAGPYLICAGTFLVILLVNIVRGLLIDPMAAIIAVRLTGPQIVFPLLAPLVPRFPRGIRQIRTSIIGATVGIAVLSMFRRTTGLLLSPYNITDGRPMLQWGGLLIAVGCVLLLSDLFRANWPRRKAVLLLISYIGLLSTGQGTANLCGIIGCGLVLMLEPGLTRFVRLLGGAVIVGALVMIWLVAPTLLSLEALSGSQSGFGDYLADRNKTNMTRHYIWQGLWNSYIKWPEIDKIIGLPSGVRPVVFIPLWNGTFWENSLHSFYLQALSTQGMVSLLMYVTLLISFLFVALFRAFMEDSTEKEPLGAPVSVALLAIVAVFGYSYDLSGELAPLLMLGFGSAWRTSRQRRRPLRLRAPAARAVR